MATNYYLLPVVLCIALYSILGQLPGLSGIAVNSTSSIKPPQPPTAGQRNSTSRTTTPSTTTADQLAQEQRLALQIITTDSLESEPQVIERSQAGSGSSLQRAASSSLFKRSSSNNNKIEQLSGGESVSDNGAITFEEQLELMDNQLRKNKEQPVGGSVDQFAKTPKRIIINLNTGPSGNSSSGHPGSSKGTKITIGFADGPDAIELPVANGPQMKPAKAASSRRASQVGGAARHRSGGSAGRALVEALHRQSGVPALIVGHAGASSEEGDGGGRAKDAPRVKLMLDAELIDQVSHRQPAAGQVTRPMQSSASSSSSSSNELTLREAIENLSNEINSLEKQFDQGGQAGPGRAAAAANGQGEGEDQQQRGRRESLSKLASSSQQSITPGHHQQQQPVVRLEEQQPLDTLSGHSENQQPAQNDLIEQPNQGYSSGAQGKQHLLLSNDNAVVSSLSERQQSPSANAEADEESLSEVADDSFADSNQSKLRAVHDANEQQPVESSQHQSVPASTGGGDGSISDEVSMDNNEQASSAQSYESTRTRLLADKLRLKKVDLSPRQYYKSASLLMDNSLALVGGSRKTSEKSNADQAVEAASELARHAGSRMSSKVSTKQVSADDANEPMDERVVRILEELKLYTTKDQLVKVVGDLLRREAQENEQLPALEKATGEQRNHNSLKVLIGGGKRNHRRATPSNTHLELEGSWQAQEMNGMETDVGVKGGRKDSFRVSSEGQVKMAPIQASIYPHLESSGSELPLDSYAAGDGSESASEKESHLKEVKSISSKTEPTSSSSSAGSQKRRWMRDVGSRMLWDFRQRHSNLKAMLENGGSVGGGGERDLSNNEVYLTEAAPGTGESNSEFSSSRATPVSVSSSVPEVHLNQPQPQQGFTDDSPESHLTREGPAGPEEYTTAIEYPTASGAAHLRQQQEATSYNPVEDRPHQEQHQQQMTMDSQSPEASRSIESYVAAASSSVKERRSVDDARGAAIVKMADGEREEEEAAAAKLQLKGIAEIKAIEQIIDELVRRETKEKQVP